ncbi:hypothetical protein Slin14017_G058090 [Septoria linicola]|nr:hypothetical protein Slin14017_G058090 [Septoria linicola]
MSIREAEEEKRIDELFSELELQVEVAIEMQDCATTTSATVRNDTPTISTKLFQSTATSHNREQTRLNHNHLEDQQWQDTQEDLAAVEMSEEDFEREFMEASTGPGMLQGGFAFDDESVCAARMPQSLKRRKEDGGCMSVETRSVVKRRRTEGPMGVVDEPDLWLEKYSWT